MSLLEIWLDLWVGLNEVIKSYLPPERVSLAIERINPSTWTVRYQHLRPGVDISGVLFLYQVMLGLGKPFAASQDAT